MSTADGETEFEEGARFIVFEYWFTGVDSIAENISVVVNISVDTMDAQLSADGKTS